MGCGASVGSLRRKHAAVVPLGSPTQAQVASGGRLASSGNAALKKAGEVADLGSKVSAVAEFTEAAGLALLELGKEMPYVAPLAVLIGACVRAAAEAELLRQDCQAFQRLVVNLEELLLKAELHGAEAICEELRRVLEEGLAHCHRCKKAHARLLTKTHSAKFVELKAEVHRLVSLLHFQVAVDLQGMLLVEFRQTQELQATLKARGGAAAVVGDDAVLGEILERMSGEGQVVCSMVKQGSTAILRSLEGQSAENQKRHEVLQDKVDELTAMLGALLKMKEKEPSAKEVRDFAEARPLGPRQAEQLLAQEKYGVSSEMTCTPDMVQVARRALDALGCKCVFMSVPHEKFCGYSLVVFRAEDGSVMVHDVPFRMAKSMSL